MSRDWGKLSNVLRRVSSKLNFPPKSCMPSRENMMMKRKSRSNREAMERTEFRREATRLDREFQYLGERHPLKTVRSFKTIYVYKNDLCQIQYKHKTHSPDFVFL